MTTEKALEKPRGARNFERAPGMSRGKRTTTNDTGITWQRMKNLVLLGNTKTVDGIGSCFKL